MNDWPIERVLDERLRRIVTEEVAAADPRQIVFRNRPRARGFRAGTGLAVLAAGTLIVALVWRSQGTAPFGGPSESNEASPTPTTTVSATPGASSSLEAAASPQVTAAASQTPASAAIGTPGPTADSATGSGKTLGCVRTQAVAVTLSDGKVLVAGGCEPNDASSPWAVGSAEIFDPQTGRFSPTGTMTVPRVYGAAALLSDGRVFFAGGIDADHAPAVMPATDEIYDPATGRFSPVGPVKPRASLGLALLNDGRVLIVAGDQEAPASDTAEIYDPRTSTFQAVGKMVPGDISGGVAVSTVPLDDGRILVVGSTNFDNPTVSVQVFDPRAATFTKGGTSSVTRDASLIAVRLPDGRAIIVGGDQVGSVDAYDATKGSFSPLAPMPKPMNVMSCTVLKDGRILALGTVINDPQPLTGMKETSSGGLFDPLPAAGPGRSGSYLTGPFNVTGELYDPSTNSWTVFGHLNEQRSQFSVVALHDGRALIIGGSTNTVEFFDPKTGKFTLNR
jgi:hypothetical protein